MHSPPPLHPPEGIRSEEVGGDQEYAGSRGGYKEHGVAQRHTEEHGWVLEVSCLGFIAWMVFWCLTGVSRLSFGM